MVIGDYLLQAGSAARAFESRWLLSSLRLIDPDLYERFCGQRLDWEKALVTGDRSEVQEQTDAMVRAWGAATARMEGVEPSAYLMGQDPNTGLRVAITNQLSVADRLEDDCVLVTPDEVAMLLAAQKEILKVKQLFPGATVEEMARRQDEP
jgi:hypothetical protein